MDGEQEVIMKSNKTKRSSIDKRTLIVRAVAWVLVAMMVVTALYTAIYYLVVGVSAADHGEVSVAVGILYENDTDIALTAQTTNGYIVGSETVGTV